MHSRENLVDTIDITTTVVSLTHSQRAKSQVVGSIAIMQLGLRLLADDMLRMKLSHYPGKGSALTSIPGLRIAVDEVESIP